jgi:hypothetical protein
LQKPLSEKEYLLISKSGKNGGVACFEGYEYNARPLLHTGGKLFIVASRDIQPGEEIFYPYSW